MNCAKEMKKLKQLFLLCFIRKKKKGLQMIN